MNCNLHSCNLCNVSANTHKILTHKQVRQQRGAENLHCLETLEINLIYEIIQQKSKNTTFRMLITNEMHNSYNQFSFHNFCPLYMFRTNLVVHHQKHGIMYCITQFGTIGTIVQASPAVLKFAVLMCI